jgi:TolB protein
MQAKPGPLLAAVLLLMAGICAARAELTIEITQAGAQAYPIAVVPFAAPNVGATAVHDVVGADLQRSGEFRLIPEERMLSRPSDAAQLDLREWKLLDAAYLVIGRVEGGGDANAVSFELYDVARGTRLLGERYDGIGARQGRQIAHHIADRIYETVTGVRGIFSTRIAYVTSQGERYELQVADADGHNPITILRSTEPVLSPSWSPDGRFLAYTAFSGRTPALYRQELTTGLRERLGTFPGINGAPAFAPDGRRLAIVLSKDGNPEIYVMDLANKALRRLTQHYAIDTEPTWSPDGQFVYFTSDRSGGPQVYRVAAGGGSAQRVSFEGSYNARPSLSPDGSQIAVVHGGGGYRIGVLDTRGGRLDVLTEGPLDESPSFAPNGRVLIYTRRAGNAEELATVSVDGRVRQRLAVPQARVREPAWSPFAPSPSRRTMP